VLREAELREDLLRGVQDRVVAASGAPADLWSLWKSFFV